MSTAAMATQTSESGTHLHSPPDSSKESPSNKNDASASDSELSDIEDPEDDIGDVEPESWADDGRVPVFKPTMEQFKSFPRYMKKVNPYGMRSGIVKVIPPEEWKATMPRLDEAIKSIRVKEPIKQDIMGTSGTYRQANILHQRSYNLPQWRQLCEQSEHQPPAKRGERRLGDKPVARPPPKAKSTAAPTSGLKKKSGRPFKNKAKAAAAQSNEGSATPDRLPTPVSPSLKPEDDMESIKQEVDDFDDTPSKGRMGGGMRGGKAISVSSRRKYNRREAAAKVDEAAFKDFEYELHEEFSAERCEELERAYWKTLTYAPPLYGADMPGSLFTDSTTTWNLGKLENILDAMGTKIPGVNTAYLYLGMWKATFAWHLEDVDLYSINYLHFGAPKQWYSISQGDARRFEAAMKSIWPTDAKACDQFLRHKTFLISPAHLLQNFNIKVNKIVCYPGEFVITFPYGYHSGYNLGYNCAEAVNFGMESWLEYGRVAKKCDCSQAQDSVWIDVRELERKMRGEETEYEESEEEEEEEEEEIEGGLAEIATSAQQGGVKVKVAPRKRKRPATGKTEQPVTKRVRLRLKPPAKEPCMLCPNDIRGEPLLLTEEGEKVHAMCALYIPETYIDSGEGGTEIVRDVKHIAKARLDLKCNYCRSKKGACFQCSQKKCIRAYHATCAAAAGVFVEQGEIPVFGEDGTEYKDLGIEFSCRFHRTKREKNLDHNDLCEDPRTRKTGAELKVGDTSQFQYGKAEIFAGIVVENRKSEEMLLVDILPRGQRLEIEYKWILLPALCDYKIIPPSANAIPLPKSFKAKESLNTSARKADDLPRADDPFIEGHTWAEFKTDASIRNPYQVKIDFTKDNQIWYYLGKTSTEARAQYTESLALMRHNPKGNYLDTIPKPAAAAPRLSYGASYPTSSSQHGANSSNKFVPRPQPVPPRKDEKPYAYKPRVSGDNYHVDQQAYNSQQSFLHTAASPAPSLAFGSDPRWRPSASTAPAPAKTPYRPVTTMPSVPAAAPYPNFYSYNNTPSNAYQPPQPQQAQQSIARPASSHQVMAHNHLPQQTAQPSSSNKQQAGHNEASSRITPQASQQPRPVSQQSTGQHQGTQQMPNYHNTQQAMYPQLSGLQPVVSQSTQPPASHYQNPRPVAPPQNVPLTQAQHDLPAAQHQASQYSMAPQPRVVQQPKSQSPIEKTQTAPQQSYLPQSRVSQEPKSIKPPQGRAPLAPPAPYRAGQQPPTMPQQRQNPFSKPLSRPNPFAKYAYLQKEHNRSPLEYRSPYRPGGGFMNGYQGDIERHLQQTMFNQRKQSSTSSNVPTLVSPHESSHTSTESSTKQQSPQGYASSSTTGNAYYGVSNMPQQPNTQRMNSGSPSEQQSKEQREQPQLHPAIRSEYANKPMLYNQNDHQNPASKYSRLTIVDPLHKEASEMQEAHPKHLPQNSLQEQRPHGSHQPEPSPVLQPPQQYFQPYQPHGPAYNSTANASAPSHQASMQQFHQHRLPPQNDYRGSSSDSKPLYAHQQYFQKPSTQNTAPLIGSPQPQQASDSQPQQPAYSQPYSGPYANAVQHANTNAAPYTATPYSNREPYSISPYQSTPATYSGHSPYPNGSLQPGQPQQPHARDFVDVPADSTSIVENMLRNLKKVK